uniref:Membrane spanning 4-domains A3 n=1 Tax=Otolemur garnettii TaxID=30611 RepID=H0X219_OTOGA
MASQDADDAERGTASSSGAPGGWAESEGRNNSVYQPTDGSQDCQKGELLALGAIQILNRALILALGVSLGSLQYVAQLQHFFFFTFYTGYPVWGAVFFISSGTLSVAAGRKPTRILMQNSFGMNIASAIIALVGIVLLSINLAVNSQAIKSCYSSNSPDLCLYTGSSSNGLVSLMLILTLLELCITITLSAMWCKANCCDLREATSSPPNSV